MHEDLLRLFVNEQSDSGDDDDELDTAAALLAREGVNVRKPSPTSTPAVDEHQINKSDLALKHLHLLKLAFQRLGAWPKQYAEYERLNAQIFRTFGGEEKWKGVQGTEKWDAKGYGQGKAESEKGGFEGLAEWGVGEEKVLL